MIPALSPGRPPATSKKGVAKARARFSVPPLYFARSLTKGAPMTIEKRDVRADDDGLRLDRWLKKYYPSPPHALVQSWCARGRCASTAGA